ncbi:hypothetical protein COCSADRAFT_161359 [Bipolaris sorokiniana ND90Pr]|uniref:Clr5 domain-containing protein n=1 Tax=Cochliobolus sativus (strain ND90Pr / ATCC 201652) TaxID=665912 RepID=M2SKF5_COCSN|nr:uncharacterized protein COCSADRAFT_161359 [Bipolaris sorokiniana ND90Pr]EMD62800.1 hypothetical protein COCSADRAFT_161359 [Bipolaris sorokiniana ND90Pr]
MSIELTEHDWDSHKAIIHSLYLTENRKLQGAGSVMQEMLCKYDFKATPSSSDTSGSQKETEVWDGHDRIPEKNLKKELARYGYDVAFPYGCQAPTPKTPEGLYICTPAALQDDTTLLYDLPWFQFLDTIESRISPYPDLAAVAISMVNKSISNPSQSKPQDLGTVGYMSLIPDTVISALSKCVTTGITPTLSNTVRRIHSHLRAIIPEEFERESNAGHKDTSGLIKMTGNVQHLSLAVFLLTNNMLNTEKVAVMTQLFQDTSNVQFLRSLLSVRNPTVEALAEKLLLAAIQSEHQFMAQTCLEAGADPNSQLLGRTALQCQRTASG